MGKPRPADAFLEMVSLSVSISNQEPCTENASPVESEGHGSRLDTAGGGSIPELWWTRGAQASAPGTEHPGSHETLPSLPKEHETLCPRDSKERR